MDGSNITKLVASLSRVGDTSMPQSKQYEAARDAAEAVRLLHEYHGEVTRFCHACWRQTETGVWDSAGMASCRKCENCHVKFLRATFYALHERMYADCLSVSNPAPSENSGITEKNLMITVDKSARPPIGTTAWIWPAGADGKISQRA